MSIIASELKLYKSVAVNNTAANGGKLSVNEIVTNIKNNIFPDVSQAERLSGIVRYRKVFPKLTNVANEILFNPKLHFRSFTPGEDYVELFEATQIDTQTDITGSERMYGAGALQTNTAAGATEIVCVLEETTQDIFETTGNTIFITDGVNEEYFTNVSAVKSGVNVTLTLDTTFTTLNSYLAAETTIASVLFTSESELKPTFDAVSETTVGDGFYDDTGFPVEGDNNGSVEETFTITFTSSTEFDCVGASAGALGSGNITSDFQPTNTDFAKPYFTLRAGGWNGVWATWDTLEIVTHPATKPLWLKQTVLAGCASYAGNNFNVRFAGESA